MTFLVSVNIKLKNTGLSTTSLKKIKKKIRKIDPFSEPKQCTKTTYRKHGHEYYSRQLNYWALATKIVIFLWFDCKFLSSHACYKQYKVYEIPYSKLLFQKCKQSSDLKFRKNLKSVELLFPCCVDLRESIVSFSNKAAQNSKWNRHGFFKGATW